MGLRLYKNFSNGTAYADLDNDGDLEIIVNNIDQEAQIFNNNSSHNFIKIKLKGSDLNPFGIGARVFVKSGDLNQMQEMTLSRGFQSSVSPEFHFGLSDNTSIDLISIEWPNGNYFELANPEINQMIALDIKDSYSNEADNSKYNNLLFSSEDIIEHKHIENDYNDYEKEVLLPHQNSKLGPGIATGDINGDGLDDIVIGGAKDQPTAFYFQLNNGKFRNKTFSFSQEDSIYEDMDILLFDADNDGDNDCYIVSGGNEFDIDSPYLVDRFYINDGKGNLIKSSNSIPSNFSSGMRVSANDFDKDGDLDLFVGGRVVPGSYPLPADSNLLINESSGKEVKFSNADSSIFPFSDIGLVSSSVWTDYNNDSWDDLL